MYERIEELCQAKGITITRLCADIDVSINSYYKWKNGNRTPRELTIKQIAAYFGVSFEYLKYGKEIVEKLTEGELIAKMVSDTDFIGNVITLYDMPSADQKRAFHLIDMLYHENTRTNNRD